MSQLSIALKNSVLLALLILIIHVIACNHLHDRVAGVAGAVEELSPGLPRGARHDTTPTTAVPSPQPRQYETFAAVDNIDAFATSGTKASTASTAPTASTATAQEQQRMLEEYVFGAAEPPTADLPGGAKQKPPVGKAPSDSSAAAAAAAKVETFAQPNDMSNNMVVGCYDNESTMCGGKLFGGGLTGFDGTQAMYQKL